MDLNNRCTGQNASHRIENKISNKQTSLYRLALDHGRSKSTTFEETMNKNKPKMETLNRLSRSTDKIDYIGGNVSLNITLTWFEKLERSFWLS